MSVVIRHDVAREIASSHTSEAPKSSSSAPFMKKHPPRHSILGTCGGLVAGRRADAAGAHGMNRAALDSLHTRLQREQAISSLHTSASSSSSMERHPLRAVGLQLTGLRIESAKRAGAHGVTQAALGTIHGTQRRDPSAHSSSRTSGARTVPRSTPPTLAPHSPALTSVSTPTHVSTPSCVSLSGIAPTFSSAPARSSAHT